MRLAGLKYDSIVDGTGIRDVVFLQGCFHRCRGCHNPHTWDIGGGYSLEPHELARSFAGRPNSITISGGEPLLQLSEVLDFMRRCNMDKDRHFWLYTGFTWEDVSFKEVWTPLSKYVDVVVDGKFEEDKKDSELLFRGSSNQRIINLKESVRLNKVVEWEETIYEQV